MAVSVHTIAFKGAAGASFILLMVASIFYVLAVGSSAWSRGDKDEVTGLYGQQGLWQSCQCLSDSSLSPDWFVAVQVLSCVGLFGLLVAIVISTLYMCLHKISKNGTIIALVVTCFITAAVMLSGVILYGVEGDEHDWGFAMAVIGTFFTLAAGVASVIQMKQSNTRCCCANE